MITVERPSDGSVEHLRLQPFPLVSNGGTQTVVQTCDEHAPVCAGN